MSYVKNVPGWELKIFILADDIGNIGRSLAAIRASVVKLWALEMADAIVEIAACGWISCAPL
jgi:hypothetical protein